MPRGALVTDVAAERAARAVIAAGAAWEGLREAVADIQRTGLAHKAVALLIADELDLEQGDVTNVIRALSSFPVRHLSTAA